MRSARPFFVSSIFFTTLPISPSVIISPFLFFPHLRQHHIQSKEIREKEGRQEIECNNRERRERKMEKRKKILLSHFLFLFLGPRKHQIK